ncbi:MAG TPA: ABC transporter ATP-binding protein [Thermoanaerobaculia bacterium]|nr:ABC transporter ATP-binding protein [Thermoanaerobaculia bacterium]
MPTSSEAIIAEGLRKLYRLGEGRPRHNTLRDLVASAFRGSLRGRKEAPAIWALDGVSFTVARGEVVGILGRNGAGKSTLLKVLSRITEPTEGWADIHGRVGSLLEVGTGFHSELTGRENLYLSGAILGMRRAEIARKFDEIVEFAEVARFIDTPVKHYSSGMYLRLAFAVAAHLEPEILLVDEVLAVGDAAFQKKCLGKMGDVAREGRTVLFVSHNLVAIESLCGRALWIDGGRIVREGPPGAVVSEYVRAAFSPATERVWSEADAPRAEGVRLCRTAVRPDEITVRTPLVLEFDVWNGDPAAHVTVSMAVYNGQDLLLFDVCPPLDPLWREHPSPAGLLRTRCHIPGDLLNDGLHRVSLIVLRDHRPVIREPEALVFTVQDTTDERDGWYGHWPGAIRPAFRWETLACPGQLPEQPPAAVAAENLDPR